MKKQKAVMMEVDFERQRQDGLWGRQDHDEKTWLSILLEEVGEVAKAANERDDGEYRIELVQVAAVAVAMIESLDRNGSQF